MDWGDVHANPPSSPHERVERGRQWIRERAKALNFEVDEIRWRLIGRDLLKGDIVHAGRVVTDIECRLDELEGAAG